MCPNHVPKAAKHLPWAQPPGPGTAGQSSAGQSQAGYHLGMVFIQSIFMLVGGLEHFYFPMTIGNFIIPMDELIFFRGVAQPPTSYVLFFFTGDFGDFSKIGLNTRTTG